MASTSTSASTKTVAFMGATTGVGLECLKHTLAAGHQCVALCRDPSKLAAILPAESNPNLRLITGNAHDIVTVSQLMKKDDGNLVDVLVTTVGNRPSLSAMWSSDAREYLYFLISHPFSLSHSHTYIHTYIFPACHFYILNANTQADVCGKAMTTLLKALAQLRSSGATGQPYIIACSTTGMSKFGRDIPLAMVPLYNVMLRTPHADKKDMEDQLVGSGEDFTIVQPSLLVNGASEKPVRVGIEDPKKGTEVRAIGYTISREDCGKWFAESLVLRRNAKYVNKITKITW